MGKAYGELMKEEIAYNMENMMKYIKSELNDTIAKKVPKFLRNIATDAGMLLVDQLLDLNSLVAKRYISARYL